MSGLSRRKEYPEVSAGVLEMQVALLLKLRDNLLT